jgi:hypothetical protein
VNSLTKSIVLVALGFVAVAVQASHECTQIVPYTGSSSTNVLRHPFPVRGEIELVVHQELFDDQKDPDGLQFLPDSNPNTPTPQLNTFQSDTVQPDFREYYAVADAENDKKEEQKTREALHRELPPFAGQLYYYDNFKQPYLDFFAYLAQEQKDEIKQRDRKTMSELVIWNDRDKICSILRKYVPQQLCDVIVDYMCIVKVIQHH